jgi:hypothetical protein
MAEDRTPTLENSAHLADLRQRLLALRQAGNRIALGEVGALEGGMAVAELAESALTRLRAVVA